MEVILKKNLDGIGRFGEIKEVKNGYARNYLIPNGLVVLATAKAREEIEKERAAFEKEHEAFMAEIEAKSKEIDGKTVSFEVKSSGGKIFGSISNKDVAEKINAGHKLNIDKRNVKVETIHEPGEYKAEISFGEGVKAEVNISVVSPDGEIKGE